VRKRFAARYACLVGDREGAVAMRGGEGGVSSKPK